MSGATPEPRTALMISVEALWLDKTGALRSVQGAEGEPVGAWGVHPDQGAEGEPVGAWGVHPDQGEGGRAGVEPGLGILIR